MAVVHTVAARDPHNIQFELWVLDRDAANCGIPTSFVFGGKHAVGQDGVIAEHNPNFSAKGLAFDGKGIDHGEDVYGAAIGAAIDFCSP